MLDCGTEMDSFALCKLYKYMMVYPDCGGCCGEIVVDRSEKAQEDIGTTFIRLA